MIEVRNRAYQALGRLLGRGGSASGPNALAPDGVPTHNMARMARSEIGNLWVFMNDRTPAGTGAESTLGFGDLPSWSFITRDGRIVSEVPDPSVSDLLILSAGAMVVAPANWTGTHFFVDVQAVSGGGMAQHSVCLFSSTNLASGVTTNCVRPDFHMLPFLMPPGSGEVRVANTQSAAGPTIDMSFVVLEAPRGTIEWP